MRAAAVLLAAAAATAGAANSSRPHIVLFVPDEMYAGAMGVYGNPIVQTPRFSELAAEGSLFTQAHTTHTVCTPSRCSFLTGRYVHQAGHRTLWDPLRYYEGNLLRVLKSAGYAVNWYGKNDALDFESFPSSVSSAEDVGSSESGANAYPDITDPRFYSFVALPPPAGVNATSDMSNTAAAASYVRAHAAAKNDTPFVIYLPLISPHPPYGCASPWYDMYANASLPSLRPYGLPGKPDFHSLIRFYRNLTKVPDELLTQVQTLYYGCITFSDMVFGVLVDALKEVGYWDNTAVFMFSDHGDYHGNYGLVEKWPSGVEDLLTHVPLIMKVPGGVPGQVFNGLVHSMDITPTILEMLNLSANWTMSAVSQYPRVMGRAPDDLARTVFTEGGYATYEPLSFEGRCDDPNQPGMCNVTNIYYPKGWQQQHNPLSVCRTTAIRTPTHKLVRRSDPQDPDHYSELYDLTADPTELNNVYNNPAYASVQANLTYQLLNFLIQTGDITPWDEQSRATPDGNWTVHHRRLQARTPEARAFVPA